jgi:hypothetical protein
VERIAGHQLDRIPRNLGWHWQSQVRLGVLFDDASFGIYGDRGRAVHGRSFSFGPIRWGDIFGYPVLLPHPIDAIFSTVCFHTHQIVRVSSNRKRKPTYAIFLTVLGMSNTRGSVPKVRVSPNPVPATKYSCKIKELNAERFACV